MLRTKIVCTLGPASSSLEVIRSLVAAGMNMARINMSHGDHDSHRRVIEGVRTASREAGRPVPILVDLAGPKIRVGVLQEPVELTVGGEVVFAPESDAGPGEIPTGYEELAQDVQPGDPVMLDDGIMELETLDSDGARARFRVVKGGLLKSR